MFVEAFKRAPGSVWIMKPIGRAQGKGIFLFTKLSEISEWKKDHTWTADRPQAETYVAQRYIENPYTIGGMHRDYSRAHGYYPSYRFPYSTAPSPMPD